MTTVLVSRTDSLRTDQSEDPLLWVSAAGIATPRVSDDDLEPAFGSGASRRIKTWGHSDGLHWLATRSGTPLHTDPAYDRYSYHLLVRNDGFRIRGVADTWGAPLVPGVVYCLDTHSPHEVVDDPRLGTLRRRRYKVQLVHDSPSLLDQGEVVAMFEAAIALGLHPRDGAGAAPLVAPRH